MKLDEFRSRRPIDVIAKTNPVLIIDEPQSVEGKQTKIRLREFCPLLTLRYSATHKSDSVYNMVYRLDAMEAYNKRLVKKIAVKGITETGSTATDSYIYLESINLSASNPTATLQFEVKMANGTTKKKSRICKIGDNLYVYSNELEEYKQGFVIKQIDGRDSSVEFLNGIRICAGDVIGAVDEDQLRRIQIRETILSHIERERQLFRRGIKVLSLFFIDEVAKYREYDEAGQPVNGLYAQMFEEEYEDILSQWQFGIGEEEYETYLRSIDTGKTHAGYFSVDGKGKVTDSKITNKKEATSDDVSAYELIMKNKELLLDRDPRRSPVRFIFSHSALREGWDNPNVFQICTLKQSGSEVRKRQEVGRGLRLCVNQDGDRMDAAVLGRDVHNVNILTVIASESYEKFADGLQKEIAEAVADRPRKVTAELFEGETITDIHGNEQVIDSETAQAIHFDLIVNGYIDKKGMLTDKYYEDKANGEVKVAEEVADSAESIVRIIDRIYDPKQQKPENARGDIRLERDEEKYKSREFRELWSRINAKTVYVVDFDTNELIAKAIAAINSKLRVTKIYFSIEKGSMNTIESKDALQQGTAFRKEQTDRRKIEISANANVKYDLIGKLVEETGLTRKAVVAILQGIQPAVFSQFKDNPEEFIVKAAAMINDEKATAIIQHITYHVLDERYDADAIFTDSSAKGRLGVNAVKAGKHLYDHVIYDSTNELNFVSALDTSSDVAVYVKLPGGFYISTPVGKYNPDWAIAFYEGSVKHIYFVAETKGTMDTLRLNHITPVEQSKIDCARAHFQAISGENVVYDVVDGFQSLMDKVMK